jgi:hypothetical protein
VVLVLGAGILSPPPCLSAAARRLEPRRSARYICTALASRLSRPPSLARIPRGVSSPAANSDSIRARALVLSCLVCVSWGSRRARLAMLDWPAMQPGAISPIPPASTARHPSPIAHQPSAALDGARLLYTPIRLVGSVACLPLPLIRRRPRPRRAPCLELTSTRNHPKRCSLRVPPNGHDMAGCSRAVLITLHV